MSTYKIKLIKKEDIAKDTIAFHFEKPDGFSYKAGQFGEFTLINPNETDEEGNTRAFSFASAPFEDDLMVATRIRDTAFKRVMKDLPLGTDIQIDAPYGDFILHKTEATPAVFLVGGIGITPIRSIIAEATYSKLPHKLFLFYFNKTLQNTAFFHDFETWEKVNTSFKFIPVMTEDKENWDGESGHITKEMLIKYLPDLTSPIYYLSGPANTITAMREILIKSGANEDNIRTEEFPGY